MPRKPAAKKVEDAIVALDTVRMEWLRRPGVTAVDVGFKITDGKLQDDVAVRVHVERKIPASELSKTELFNETGKTPKKVKGIPVDVIEATYAPSTAPIALDDVDAAVAVDRRSEVDPLIGGISCANRRVTAGTLGAIVFDRTTCKPMILSNWHVLAGSAAAAVGEDILQPGRVDGGTEVVATLTKMRLDSRMDAAVATLNGARSYSRDILGLGAVKGIDTPTLGMNVVKSGRTTGITEGIVDGVSLSTSINYTDPGVVAFSNQVRIVPRPPWPQVNYEVSMGGDSGSVWLNEANDKAIGLHFAGEVNPSPAAENAICSPMAPIATELGFSFGPVICKPKLKFPPIDWRWRYLCLRFPWLCANRFPVPKPPWPGPRPGDPFGGPGGGLSGGFPVGPGPDASTGGGSCSCGGGELDDALLQALLADAGWE
jgi:hypothetical protein